MSEAGSILNGLRSGGWRKLIFRRLGEFGAAGDPLFDEEGVAH